MDWSRHRRPDGTIDLRATFAMSDGHVHSPHARDKADSVLQFIESLEPIRSRQAAAVALSLAEVVARLSR